MEFTEFGEYGVYSDGMYAYVVYRGAKVKEFTGELAWSDAERYAQDKMFETHKWVR